MAAAPAQISLDAWVPASHPPAQSGISRRRQGSLGRSGPRSRSGCVICKQRRVRCDQVHPTCGHCTRMQLDCYYKPQLPRSRTNASGSKRQSQSRPTHTTDPSSPSYYASHPAPDPADEALTWMETLGDYTQDALDSAEQLNFPYWSGEKALSFTNLVGDPSTSTAGDISCLFPEADELSNSSVSAHHNGVAVGPTIYNATDPDTWNNGISSLPEAHTIDNAPPAVGGLPAHAPSVLQLGQVREPNASPQANADRYTYREKQPVRLAEHFLKVSPPPAAMLMGGSWQHLQQYFCRVSEQSRAVDSALSCVTELLTMEEPSTQQTDSQKAQMRQILDRHQRACSEIRAKLASNSNPRQEVSEHLLAAVFLLAWFEVTRDLDTDQSLFPRDLADAVISSQLRWSRTSEELLSWLSILDSKATHLGGEHLLSPRALEAVSRYPVRITPPNTWETFDSRRETIADPEGLPTDSSPGSGGHPDAARQCRHLVANQSPASMVQVKQAFINAVLEPALQWHLTSQTYWRRVSAHHMHHRSRSTTEDEYEVITACKQVETELFELWHFRPPIVSMTAEELRQIVPYDLASGLEQVFSVFLASFWILFVYMHRVSWWNLPHSELTRRALAEVWRQLQRAYGEDDTATATVTVEAGTPKQKVAHPSLMWLLFVFGSECTDGLQRKWAIEQFERLGEARPRPPPPASSGDAPRLETLFPLGPGAGPVRNARRAALLLTRVTEEQERLKARANVREISMQLFGCYLSIA
ncbi:Fungal Zn2-Cys6 binuclear cluster domain-containing protein [Cladophialophora immunda]|nr:Fungal Zn2-Cys6 binuclear cluster domain-containing protein [Cladophialophora immunda]